MANSITELAKYIKNKDKETSYRVMLGIVEDKIPNIKIRVDDNVLLEKKHLIIAEHLIRKEKPVTIKGEKVEDVTLEYHDEIEKGDLLILVPFSNEQKFIVFDRAVRL